ncbi:hypothetical protein ACLOAV_007479 [Pseudogymnoascus australis]
MPYLWWLYSSKTVKISQHELIHGSWLREYKKHLTSSPINQSLAAKVTGLLQFPSKLASKADKRRRAMGELSVAVGASAMVYIRGPCPP